MMTSHYFLASLTITLIVNLLNYNNPVYVPSEKTDDEINLSDKTFRPPLVRPIGSRTVWLIGRSVSNANLADDSLNYAGYRLFSLDDMHSIPYFRLLYIFCPE